MKEIKSLLKKIYNFFKKLNTKYMDSLDYYKDDILHVIDIAEEDSDYKIYLFGEDVSTEEIRVKDSKLDIIYNTYLVIRNLSSPILWFLTLITGSDVLFSLIVIRFLYKITIEKFILTSNFVYKRKEKECLA